MKFLKSFADRLFSTSAAGLYIILFAFAIGAATFVENDFGTSSAQKLIFKSWWFELLLVLFGITLIVNIFRFRMIQNKKWPLLIFHAAMIIILLGAGATRYFGSEGMMHIREGSASNSFLSAESYLQFEAILGGKKYAFDEPVLFATLGNNRMKKSYLLGGKEVQVEVLDFMPNPTEVMTEGLDGAPTFKVVIGGADGREEYFVKLGDRAPIRGTIFNFGNPEDPVAFNVKYEDGKLLFMTDVPFTQMVMATQTRDTLSPGVYRPLMLRSLYSSGAQNFVIGDFNPQGKVELASSSRKMVSSSMGALHMKVTADGKEQQFYVAGAQGVKGRPQIISLDNNTSLAISYGAKEVFLPFSIQCHDFIMERYPGTNSASSYASEVTLVDPRENLKLDQRIYMNHILNYQGYRFFQSSFDKDELGTYLSVNHDALGTWISYLGYFLLTLGMVLTFFSPKTRFRQLSENLKKMRTAEKALSVLLVGCFLAFSTPAHSAPPNQLNFPTVDMHHATEFGSLWMQDSRGRLKPMNTFTSEVLRKLSRKESLYGMTAEQIILGMAAYPGDWYAVPLIKVGKHEDIRDMLNVPEGLAAYNDFFEPGGEYKLRDLVRNAYNTPDRERGVMEKELMKLDERVNICSMIFSGSFMKAFPVPGDLEYHWQAPAAGSHQHNVGQEPNFADKFYAAYIPTIQKALDDHDWSVADKLITELGAFQQKNGGAILPSNSKLHAELFLNKLDVFGRAGKMYGMLGLVFLVLLFTSVFKPSAKLKWPNRITVGLLAFTFAAHTLGLALRWYVSGRAPWSNGYESMIYIGWTTVLAGLIFSRKSIGGLAATSVLASTILMVAGLSWLDPEITPLVPVLKSYWLTIHVSMEAGSYGFLLLGAIIGVLNLIFMIFMTQKNKKNVNRIIKEMTSISEMTLIGGLFMVSIGTYLGGVWANESWGRYWGWDAKETWALVTVLVYSFILHMRFIPGFRGTYAFNVASLFGLATVMMTYFGVNYYLSGLHSYAAGDPVPIPTFVYYTVATLLTISGLAYWRQRTVGKMA
ncbi:MAG: cytochrome c biogenesis protein CcsA [Saprospirales bacterium]|nr:cytochrome c biogenesis protein CcsA [Saprospirales bacterium]